MVRRKRQRIQHEFKSPLNLSRHHPLLDLRPNVIFPLLDLLQQFCAHHFFRNILAHPVRSKSNEAFKIIAAQQRKCRLQVRGNLGFTQQNGARTFQQRKLYARHRGFIVKENAIRFSDPRNMMGITDGQQYRLQIHRELPRLKRARREYGKGAPVKACDLCQQAQFEPTSHRRRRLHHPDQQRRIGCARLECGRWTMHK